MWEGNTDWLHPVHAPTRDWTCKPGYVPWLGIKPAAFGCTGWCSNQLSHTGQGGNSSDLTTWTSVNPSHSWVNSWRFNPLPHTISSSYRWFEEGTRPSLQRTSYSAWSLPCTKTEIIWLTLMRSEPANSQSLRHGYLLKTSRASFCQQPEYTSTTVLSHWSTFYQVKINVPTSLHKNAIRRVNL